MKPCIPCIQLMKFHYYFDIQTEEKGGEPTGKALCETSKKHISSS